MNNLNRAFDIKLIFLTLVAGLFATGSLTYSPTASAQAACSAGTLTANVVALDQPIMFNRLGAQNVNFMMYALERDVVVSNKPSNSSTSGSGYDDDMVVSDIMKQCPGDDPGTTNIDENKACKDLARQNLQGNVALRPDKRPRPLVLRVAAGQCLTVNLTNLLQPDANPRNGPVNPNNCQAGAPGDGPADLDDPNGPTECEVLLNINDQVAGRKVSFHPLGMQLVNNIDDTGSNVGVNDSSLIGPGQSETYTYFAEEENAYMAYSRGQPLGGEASGGNVGVGLFAVVNVEPKGASFYRSQVTEEEMRLATIGKTAGYDNSWRGQPIIDYEKTYPNGEPWESEGKAGLPILNMVTAGGEIVHSDINAIITGTNFDGSFTPDTYPLESVGKRNPSLPTRLEAFREFTVVFHDDTAATQAFPKFFDHPVMGHTLHGVRDSFMINYGSGGIGSEIIANRLRVGPMWDCLNCAYEEFFLSSYTVGDPAMLVDVPANANLELCGPDELAAAANGQPNECINTGSIGIGAAVPTAVHGIKASQAFYPADPSNVHHSYKRDFVKFRNLHAGPKEQHIFHLHNHQWLFNPNDDNSNYIDAQGIGPGSGYTLEINFGGSGNRNLSAGDAIFHCHFYPHFAQGMWEHWRIHDVYETGTELAVSGTDEYGDPGIHSTPFALQNGLPAVGARALPDGEILAGTPIPALVPLPGKALPPVPGAKVTVEPKLDPLGRATASVAKVQREEGMGNPGYPFWIAGIEDTVGQRATTPPLDMLTEAQAADLAAKGADGLPGSGDEGLWQHPGFVAGAGGWDGGLPRHTLEGYLQGGQSINIQNRLDFTKVIEQAKPVYYPEEGTDLEQLVMQFNAVPVYQSYSLNLDGTLPLQADFLTNGQLPVPSAPYYEPCRDDNAKLFTTGETGQFWNAELTGGYFDSPAAQFGADAPRVYKGANIQIDAVLSKVGYHYPQQRIIALWEDVNPVIGKLQAPEPLVMRSNSFDCVKYLHANLVPEYYELDDYQVRTPTDIIGQHIHLPKWDLVANDGSGNGWNYEDGTLSPGMVRERIEAINHFNDEHNPGTPHLEPKVHPFFGEGTGDQGAKPWLGARTTIQRWFTDPVVNTELADRGLGVVFTHDHYGPSTHQQVGLYATILAEPAQSTWKHNETGTPMYTRHDGGPTSWQAVIEPTIAGGAGMIADAEPFREFYFEYSDFQHAYEAGMYVGIAQDGDKTPAAKAAYEANKDTTHSPVTGPGTILDLAGIGMKVVLTDPVAPDGGETFKQAINSPFRQEPKDQQDVFPDIVRFPPWCPGTQVQGGLPVDPDNIVPRPCAEAISADDIGMLVTNYRSEPVGLRVFDPGKPGPDGHNGAQADGLGGDLAYALQTRIDRAIPRMNRQVDGEVINGTIVPPALNAGAVEPGDPYTPMVRTYPGDLVKVKIQAGAHEHEHNAIIHGVKWRQSGSSFGQAPNSGWRNAQNDGISEQFTFSLPVGNDPQNVGITTDYAYSMDASQDGWWSGMWGIMRAYDEARGDLVTLSSNENPKPGRIVNQADFNGVCPTGAPLQKYTVVAMTANQLLGNALNLTLDTSESAGAGGFASEDHVGARPDQGGGTLVYNNRPGGDMRDIGDSVGDPQNSQALHDPTALLYVNVNDLEPVTPGDRACRDNRNLPGVIRAGCDARLKANAPIEPVAIRGAAGDCIEVTLFNKLPQVAPDLAGYNTLLQMVNRRVDNTDSLLTFNNNLIRPSSHVGLHAQLVEYDASQDDGANVGLNQVQTVGPVNPDGSLDKSQTYRWYAGHLSTRVATPQDCKDAGVKGKGCGQGNDLVLLAEPVELGGFNLNPADKVKQGQKGLVGAGVVLPQFATWNDSDRDVDDPATQDSVADLDQVMDHQVAGNAARRATRLSMEVDNSGEPLKDVALVFQKGLNQRFSNAKAIPNVAAEGQGVPEDSHDAGQMAISYGTEPLWYRFNRRADAPFGNAPDGLGTVGNSHEAYSNNLAGVNGDPVTPVVTAKPKQDLYIRLLMPTGAGRGTTFVLDNHAWQRDPYICEGAMD
ncbi:MAG: hypothetical protein OER43_15970, partial [Gammaproteobacteria bacterium]|nr:hypothetical protein [Gammaproteobacteria bacterium]